jgi:hypothetical protein
MQVGPQAFGRGRDIPVSQFRSPGPLTTILPTELTENVDADRPPVVLLEGLPLEGDKQSPSTGQGPFFYIGGTNGASM